MQGESRGAGGTPAGRAGFQDHGDPRAPVAEPPGHRGDTLPGSSGEEGTEGRGKREEKKAIDKGRKGGGSRAAALTSSPSPRCRRGAATCCCARGSARLGTAQPGSAQQGSAGLPAPPPARPLREKTGVRQLPGPGPAPRRLRGLGCGTPGWAPGAPRARRGAHGSLAGSLTPGAGSQSPGAPSQSQTQPTARLSGWHGKSKSSGRSRALFYFPTWSNHPSLPADCLLSALQSSPLPHFQAQEHSHPAKPLCPAPTGPDLAAPGSATRGLERQAGCQSLRRACGWFMEGGIGSARLLLSAPAAQLLAWCILLVGRVPGGSQKIPQIDALGVQPPEGEGKAHPGQVRDLQGVL